VSARPARGQKEMIGQERQIPTIVGDKRTRKEKFVMLYKSSKFTQTYPENFTITLGEGFCVEINTM
jgi:hypothetical protein